MSLTQPKFRIAIAQIPMHWTIEENVSAMRSAMRLARSAGATLCTFSELAVTRPQRLHLASGRAALPPARAEFGVGVFNLGESLFEWHGQ